MIGDRMLGVEMDIAAVLRAHGFAHILHEDVGRLVRAHRDKFLEAIDAELAAAQRAQAARRTDTYRVDAALRGYRPRFGQYGGGYRPSG